MIRKAQFLSRMIWVKMSSNISPFTTEARQVWTIFLDIHLFIPFLSFRLFNEVDINQMFIFLMTGFEPRTSGIGSDHSTNRATALTVHQVLCKSLSRYLVKWKLRVGFVIGYDVVRRFAWSSEIFIFLSIFATYETIFLVHNKSLSIWPSFKENKTFRSLDRPYFKLYFYFETYLLIPRRKEF